MSAFKHTSEEPAFFEPAQAMRSWRDESRQTKDYLWLHLRELPYFRAMLRAVEARFYQDISLPPPTLDLGCGDGHFATLAFDRRLDVGIDPWRGPIRLAQRRAAYRLAVHGLGGEIPFADGVFSSAVSNSVLEHIPDLTPVLAELRRVLKPGASFIFCVPNHQFLPNLSNAVLLDRLGFRRLAGHYRVFFNRISRHYHCDDVDVWKKRLSEAGFEIEHYWHYFSPQALAVFEWGHFFGLPCLLPHFLLGRWVIAPAEWNLFFTRRLVKPYYDEDARHPQGAYTFYITRRKTG